MSNVPSFCHSSSQLIIENPSTSFSCESHTRGQKRARSTDASDKHSSVPSSVNTCRGAVVKQMRASSKIVDYYDPFSISDVVDELDHGRYGSVTEEIKALISRKFQVLSPIIRKFPELLDVLLDGEKSPNEVAPAAKENIINLDDDIVTNVCPAPASASASSPLLAKPVVILDSDDEDGGDHKPTYPFQEVVLPRSNEQSRLEIEVRTHLGRKNLENLVISAAEPYVKRDKSTSAADAEVKGDIDNDNIQGDKGLYVGAEEYDGPSEPEDDGLGDIWNEMSVALDFSKDVAEYPSPDDQMQEDEEDCDHSFVLKDDLGDVCRICGVIKRRIDTIIEVQYNKKRSTRTYAYESRITKERDSNVVGVELLEEDLPVIDISPHPMHMKHMKPHQVEGFNFLRSNLVSDNPGGCILAHAPGSGKTFMIISFMQSFLAKYPHARPLVVLPKGILATWKKEFQIWQVEDIPLYDFYSGKADSRIQQLEVLKKWVEKKSILFLGYKQFSSIVCDDTNTAVSSSCQQILLKKPSILILDEGHTPRNENTDVLQSLAKVQTPRKVVLSGTLYQNHVKEVFNILNLVRPKFLRSDSSKDIKKRIMSRVQIQGFKKNLKSGESTFYDLVEHTIQDQDFRRVSMGEHTKQGEEFRRKVSIIQDLREMTSKVLHYYRGDFLDELPGLVDFTVVLKLSKKQKEKVQGLKKLPRKFKVSAVGSAVYLHANLNAFSENILASSENNLMTDDKMDEFLGQESSHIRDGVKGKFFLDMLRFCESSGEKLLVFSQYLTPLKYLERLAVREKGWVLGREIFVISGESSYEQRERSMDLFNNSSEAKVFFGSIKACGEGISLVGASRIIILDVPLNPSVTRQAIGRAFRPGQKKKVYAYRLVAADSPEEEDHSTCFRKEAIAKMWFEWHENCGYQHCQVKAIDLEECGDRFFEKCSVKNDVKVLYTR